MFSQPFPQSPESAPLWLFRRLPTHTHTKREIRKTPLILGGHRWLFFFSSSIHPSVDIMRWEPFSIHFSAFLWRVFSQCSFFCCPDREVKNRLANRTGEKSGDESIVFQLNTWAIWRKWGKQDLSDMRSRRLCDDAAKDFLDASPHFHPRTRASIYMLMRCDYPCGMV
jgi:hypothetical protein